MNVFSFTGNLGKDCRVATVGSSTVCNFTVAVKSGWGDKAQTLWIDCAVWGKQAESKLPEYLLKGQAVAVSGELGSREHEGKTYLTCRADSVGLIGSKSEGSPPEPATDPTPTPGTPKDDFEDDIPF